MVFYNSRNFLRLNIDKESEVNGSYELNNEISTQKKGLEAVFVPVIVKEN